MSRKRGRVAETQWRVVILDTRLSLEKTHRNDGVQHASIQDPARQGYEKTVEGVQARNNKKA